MDKTPTIDDVAIALGMHKSTVSKALSGKGTVSLSTRDRVRRVARELGYEPNPVAQRLAIGYRSPLVYLFTAALDLGMATQKIRLLQAALHREGLEAPIYIAPDAGEEELLVPPTRSQAEQMRQLCRQRPRAIVCASQRVEPDVYAVLAAYQRDGGIVVGYDSPLPLRCDQVIFDREHNAYLAAHCLLEAGHRKIGIGMSHVPGWLRDDPNVPQSARLRGFRRALEEYGVTFRPEWLFANPHYEEGGESMARKFLALPERPTALSIVNDHVAFAFLVDVMRAGMHVPEEISVVSHDNQPIAARCPVPLTAATHPVEEIARTVVELLLQRIQGFDGPPRTVTLNGELIQRQSVAAPPP